MTCCADYVWWYYDYIIVACKCCHQGSIISFTLLDTRISDCDGFAGNTSRRSCNIASGWQETASEPLCHFPRQCWMVNWYLRVFFFSQNSWGFWIFSGSWSVTTITFRQPMTNIHFSNAHAITAASPSIGAYLQSVSVQNLLPANIRYQPSRQQIGAFSTVHRQCFCRSRKPIFSLFQSGARQVIKRCHTFLD